MAKLGSPFLALLLLCYPFAAAWAVLHHYSVWLSLALLAIALLRYVLHRHSVMAPIAVLAVPCASISLLLGEELGLRLYPVLINLALLLLFTHSLLFPPPMIERFARLAQPELPAAAVLWTRRVTQVWCGFFAFNMLMAGWTVIYGSMQLWAWYNGGIAYLLMGLLLLGEWILRKKYRHKSGSS
jgi:uncharacterized membrane protein